jgi:hypothetical protein
MSKAEKPPVENIGGEEIPAKKAVRRSKAKAPEAPVGDVLQIEIDQVENKDGPTADEQGVVTSSDSGETTPKLEAAIARANDLKSKVEAKKAKLQAELDEVQLSVEGPAEPGLGDLSEKEPKPGTRKARSKKTRDQEEAEPESLDTAEPKSWNTSVPKKGLFAWLASLFKSKKKVVPENDELVLEEEVAEALPEGLLETDLELAPNAIKKELAKQRREVRELAEARERLESEVTSKTEQMNTYAEQIDQITAWANKVSRTFIWKVQEQMDKNLEQARSDMAKHEAAVKNLTVIEPGRVLALRKKFHKSLTWALVVCGGLIAAASLIRYRQQIPRLDWLSVLYDPNISGPILVVALALVVGLVILFSRRSKSKSHKLSRVIWLSMVAFFIAWVVWDSSRNGSFMQRVVNPFIDRHFAEIVTTLASIWVLWVVTSLITYYRGYSIFNREVDTQILSLEGVIEGYVKTQQEISRLGILYRQTNDWLEILANALYRPWKTNPEWGTSKEYTSHYDTFPFALRVAQAREGADARMQELERIIGSRLLTQGWRNDAFEDLVAQVGTEMGLPPGKFNVDLLDQDLPHQTNNSRALLKRFLIHSAKTSYSGKVDLGSNSAPPQTGRPEPTDRYLVEVARKRLLDLIEKTQSVAISAARPRVQQIFEDPLVSLRADSAGVDEFDPTESWDEFLTDSLGTESVDETPLGVLSFTEEGRMKNWPSKVQSYVLVPRRLEKSLPNISSDRITIVPLGDDRPRSLEIIARIDVVGPAEFSAVALLGAGAQRKVQQTSKITNTTEKEEEL